MVGIQDNTLLSLSNPFLPVIYELGLDISPSKPNFSGCLSIQLQKNINYSQSEATSTFTLHSSNIIITSAIFSQNGLSSDKIKAVYDRQLETVSFDIPIEFQQSESFSLTLNYMGKINQIKTFRDFTKGIYKTNYLDSISGKASNHIIATHSQPSFAKLIFPLIDEVSCKIPIKLSITTDLKFQCASNMPLLTTEFTEDDRKVFNFKTSPPMSFSTFGFVLGDLEFMESTVTLQDNSQIPLRFITPIGEVKNSTYGLSVASKILPHLEKLIKFPFPLEKIDFVALPFLSDGAMENWGLITIKQDQLLVPSYLADNRVFTQQIRQVIAHELVHQWVGNLVTFESWDHIWLNEAFATFLALHCLEDLVLDSMDENIWIQQLNELENIMNLDSIEDSGISVARKYKNKITHTHDAFQKDSYYKGIFLLRQLGNVLENDKADDSYSILLKGVSNFLNDFKFKSAKPLDLWKCCHSISSDDILALMYSWTNLPGLPLVSISLGDAKDSLLIEQHRYIYNATPKELNMEDNPYHVPLNIRKTDGMISKFILNDRKTEVKVSLKDFVLVNSNGTGYYKVRYSLELLEQIAESIKLNKISEIELSLLINDMGSLIGQSYSTKEDFIGFFKILDAISSKTCSVYWGVLTTALNYLQLANNAFYLFTSENTFDTFEKTWLNKFLDTFYHKLDWSLEFDLSHYNADEMTARNALMLLGLKNKNYQAVGNGLFKLITQGPRKSIPKELLSSAFTIKAYLSTQKEYKQILALVKNATITTNNTNASATEIQTAAVSSLGYAQKNDLISKTLNFVMTNIDSKMIELSILGLQLNPSKTVRLQLWSWFKLHYDEWIIKSLRPGSEYSAQLSNTMKNLTKMIFGCMNSEEEIRLKEEFIKEKQTKLPKHGLDRIIETLELESGEQRKIASYEEDLIAILISTI